LSTELSESKDNYALERLEKRIRSTDLLILDEMGYTILIKPKIFSSI